MSFYSLWVHVVFSTKSRYPHLVKSLRKTLIQHIIDYASQNNIHVNFINGYIDHLHLLISMNSNQSIAEVVQLIKGESSHWINKNNFTETKFEWQREYYASTISYQDKEEVRNYIRCQEKHHMDRSFDEEMEELLKQNNYQ